MAAPFLILLGGLGGFLVVPMNALLQHRGHNLMGAGRSIAVQNFNEQACILGLGAFYSLSTGMGLSAFGAITAFGVVVAGLMWLIRRWHQQQLHQAPGRGRAPADHRAQRQPARLSASGCQRARCWPPLALMLNAFVWGVSWWPFRQLRGARPAPAVGHRADLRWSRWRCLLAVRPRGLARLLQHPAAVAAGGRPRA